MLRRIGPVQTVAAVEALDGTVRRSDRHPAEETGGIAGRRPTAPAARGAGHGGAGPLADAGDRRLPAVVRRLGAAQRLGIDRARG